MKTVVELVQKLEEIRKKESASIEFANSVLYQWQHEVYQEADMTKNRNGVQFTHEQKKFTDFDICMFIETVIGDARYRAFKELVNG